MANNNGWAKIEPADAWNFEAQPTMEGIFLGVEANVGRHNSNVYSFKNDKGQKWAVWGSTVLDSRLKHLELGEEVKIVYLGKEKGENTPGEGYHNFDVFHRPAPPPDVPNEQ